MVFKLFYVCVIILLAILPYLNADIKGDSRPEEKNLKYRTITRYHVLPREEYQGDGNVSFTKTRNNFSQNSAAKNNINQMTIKYIFEIQPKNKNYHRKTYKNINNFEDFPNKDASNADMLNKALSNGVKGNKYNVVHKFPSNIQQELSDKNETYNATEDYIADYLKVVPKQDNKQILKNESNENTKIIPDNRYVHDEKRMDAQDTPHEVYPFELPSKILVTGEQSETKPTNQVYIGYRPDKQYILENTPINVQHTHVIMDGINMDGQNFVDNEKYPSKESIAAINEESLQRGENELNLNETYHVVQANNISSSFVNKDHKIYSTENFRLLVKIIFEAAGKSFVDFWELFMKHFVKEHGKDETLFELEKLYTILTTFTQLNRAAKLGYPIDNTLTKIVDVLQQSFGTNIGTMNFTNILKNLSNEFNYKKNRYNEIDKQNLSSNENSKENSIFEATNNIRDHIILLSEATQYFNLENNQTSFKSPTYLNFKGKKISKNILSRNGSVTAVTETHIDKHLIMSKTLKTIPNEDDELEVITHSTFKLSDKPVSKDINERNSSNKINDFLNSSKKSDLNTSSSTDNPNNVLDVSYKTSVSDSITSNGVDAVIYDYKKKNTLNPNKIYISKIHKSNKTDLIKNNPMSEHLIKSVNFTQESSEKSDIRDRNNNENNVDNAINNEYLSPHIQDTISSKIEFNPLQKYKQYAIINDTSEMNSEIFSGPNRKDPKNILIPNYEDSRVAIEPEENSQLPDITKDHISENGKIEAELNIVTDKNCEGFSLMTESLTTTDIKNVNKTPNLEQKFSPSQNYSYSNPSIKLPTQIPMFKLEQTASLNLDSETFDNLNTEVTESSYDSDENKERSQSIRDDPKLTYINITNTNYTSYSEVTTEKSVTDILTNDNLKQAYSPLNLVNEQKLYIKQIQESSTNNSMPRKAHTKANNSQIVPLIVRQENYLQDSSESLIDLSKKIIQDDIKLVEPIPNYYDFYKVSTRLKVNNLISNFQHNKMEYHEPDYRKTLFLFNTAKFDYFYILLPDTNKVSLEKDNPHDINIYDIHKEMRDFGNVLNIQHNSVIEELQEELQMDKINLNFPMSNINNNLNEKSHASLIHLQDFSSLEYYTENSHFISNKKVAEDLSSGQNNKNQYYYSLKHPANTEFDSQDTHSFEFPDEYKEIIALSTYKNRDPNHQIYEEISTDPNEQAKSRDFKNHQSLQPWMPYNRILDHELENRPMPELAYNLQKYHAPIPYVEDATKIFTDNVNEIHFTVPNRYETSRNILNHGPITTPQTALKSTHFPYQYLVRKTHSKPYQHLKSIPRYKKHKARKIKNWLLLLKSLDLIPDSNLIERDTNVYEPVHFNHRYFDSDEFNIGDDKDLSLNIVQLLNKLMVPDVPHSNLKNDNA